MVGGAVLATDRQPPAGEEEGVAGWHWGGVEGEAERSGTATA